MNQPDFVHAGEPVRASTINDLVSAARSTQRPSIPDAGNMGRRFRPFDIIDVNKEDGDWTIRLQPGFVIEGSTASAILAGEDDKPLTDFPDITVEEDRNLYFKYSEKKIIWEAPDEAAGKDDLLLLVEFEFEEDGSGFTFTNKHPAPVFAKVQIAFAVKAWMEDDEGKASVAPGYVRNIMPQAGEDTITDSMPEGNGTPLDAATPPVFDVAHDDWLYCKVETDHTNKITGTPEIVVGDADMVGDSLHYQPESPNPENGLYYFPLASISIEGEVITVKQRHTGTIVVAPTLFKIENIGGKREIFHELDTASSTYKFRTIEQLRGNDANSFPILRDPTIEEEEEQGDTIEFRELRSAVDVEGETGEPVSIIKPFPEDPEDEDADSIIFRGIAQRASVPQIQVESQEDKIVIKGNDNYNTYSGGSCTSITVADGLVTAADFSEGGEGWWGTAVWKFFSPGNPSQENQVRFTFEAGRLVMVEKQLSDGPFEEVTGTEAMTGGVLFYAENVFS